MFSGLEKAIEIFEPSLRFDHQGKGISVHGILFDEDFEEFYRGEGIAGGPVPVGDHNGKLFADLTQTIRRKAGDQFAAEFQCTQRFPLEIEPELPEFLADETIVEGDVMPDDDALFSDLNDPAGNLKKFRRLCHHLIGDPGQAGDEIRNVLFRIHQGGKFIDDFFPVVNEDGNFGNFLMFRTPAGRLNIQNSKIHPSKFSQK